MVFTGQVVVAGCPQYFPEQARGTDASFPANSIPAAAAEDPVESAAKLIAAVAPHQGEILVGTESAGGIAVPTGEVKVQVPIDSSEPIVMSEAGRVDQPGFEVSLPSEVDAGEAEVAADGTIVYKSTTGGADAAVQVLEGGLTRIQTIINDASEPHAFTYFFGAGYAPVQAADGSIVVAGDDGAALFEAAWARDANGKSVATHYEIRGETLVQVVDVSADTAYPVVADPAWKWYNFVWGAKFNRYETRTMASSGGAAGMCGILATWAPPIAVVCGFYGAYFFTQASIANSQGKCVFISVVPAPLAMVYKDGDCYWSENQMEYIVAALFGLSIGTLYAYSAFPTTKPRSTGPLW